MGCDRRRSRRGGDKPKHPPWWTNPRSCFGVLVGQFNSYLVHYPQWGTPFIVRTMPAFLGYRSVPDFLEDDLIPKEYPVKREDYVPAASGKYAAPVDDLADQLLLLAEHLACVQWDGEPVGSRQTGSLLIFPQDGVWKARLVDKNTSRCLWIACSSLLDVFQATESALADPNAQWRLDRAAGHPQASRVKPGK